MGTELQDHTFIHTAIEEARTSAPEDQQVHPKVGVVVVDRDSEILARAHRVSGRRGHAEFIALAHELPKGKAFAGSTMYTTLEPCANGDGYGDSDVERIIEKKISRVVIGMLHPNEQISGHGERKLREANIRTEFFPEKFRKEVEDMNNAFILSHREPGAAVHSPSEFFNTNHERSLDDWYRTVNAIYWNRNYYCDEMNLFAHLVEISGGLSSMASHKKKINADSGDFLAKAVAWWMALCGKARVRSVADMLWTKFPNCCPYCQKSKHDNDECTEMKAEQPGPDWQALSSIGVTEAHRKPVSLGDWQRMFSQIYTVEQVESSGISYARLCEELGELAEAIRVLPAEPGYFLSEAADVFAWLMHIQSAIDIGNGVSRKKRGDTLVS